ncbi:MAG: thioredoxin domain-containing protein [Nitrospinaceae bacterium]|nr:MAG: thioredoxin domain-containing protein [Nitrospinaceae bacterium]
MFGPKPVQSEEQPASNNKPATQATKKYNRLIHEKSPYLQQHANNPIFWYPWGKEAFQAAVAENKPIFLSIGYSTCHWCHVLERESFETQEVGDLLNESFISIKVDREELPDVDHIYMTAVQAMTGNGGWPMTVVMTPERHPFFGGTYFPKEELIHLLNTLRTAWTEQPEKIAAVGARVQEFLQSSNEIATSITPLNEEILKNFYKQLSKRFDSDYGGFGSAPKFPPTMQLKVLLRIAQRTGDKKSLAMVETTLNHMARGGMYDHLGGGFHRYSTDRIWMVPHFEKMLYNQAGLSSVYLEAFQRTQNKMFESVARETLDYVLREMTGPEGGFYSAEDADSEGEEGVFYVWASDALKKILNPKEYEKISKIYGVTHSGNFGSLNEGTNIFQLQESFAWKIKSDRAVRSIHKKLFSAREKREHPFKDDKIITAWNGLMLNSMAQAYQILGDQKYLAAAQSAARFIKSNLYINDKLLRRFRQEEAKYPGGLDDYAYLIQGLITLYESDFDERWILWAESLQTKQDALFWDLKEGGYFLSEENANFLPVRNKEFSDGARPNSNAVSALNLLRLYNLTFDEKYILKARKILSTAGDRIHQFPTGFSQMLIALDFYLDRSKEIAVVGPQDSPKKDAILKKLHTRFIPNKVLAYAPPKTTSQLTILKDKYTEKGETMVYVCEKNICKYPTGDINKVLKLIENRKQYSLN